MTRRRTLIAVCLLHGCILGACSGDQDMTTLLAAGGVYDVSTTPVIEHAHIPDSVPVWQVADVAELRIGAENGPYVLGRVEGLTNLGTGEIIVADSRPLQLKAFDPTGTHVWTAGRSGEGPGEFKNIARILSIRDTVVVLDRSPPRTIVFDRAGQHVRTSGLNATDPERPGVPEYRGLLANGNIVATIRTREGSTVQRDYRRFLHTLVVLNGSGETIHHGPAFFDNFLHSTRGSMTQADGSTLDFTTLRSPPVAPQAVYAVSDQRIAVGVQGTGEVLLYDAELQPLLVIRVPGRGRSVDKSRVVDMITEQADDTGPAARSAASAAEFLPAIQPAITRVAFDSEDRLWVQEYVPPYEARHPEWWVLDQQGQFVARVAMPDSRSFEPKVFLADRILGVALNNVDVPFVERRQILK